MYGAMDDVFKFVDTFKEFPPRSFPPSFVPSTILESTLNLIKAERKLKDAFPMLDAPEKARK
jgi:arylsulfatase